MSDKLIKQLNDIEELQAYCEAQYSTIQTMSKKINILDEENKHLKGLLNQSIPALVGSGDTVKLDSTDEETICRTQLKFLRDKALGGELTLEESRKTEIYTKILQSLENKPKTVIVETKNLGNDELMAILEASNGKN